MNIDPQLWTTLRHDYNIKTFAPMLYITTVLFYGLESCGLIKTAFE